nr:MAG TPA: hypothetical protein [Caudoviricetes sp.]DAS84381.1 MAG TPA: hypothetical protein [Caudoviricetes sp.]
MLLPVHVCFITIFLDNIYLPKGLNGPWAVYIVILNIRIIL